MSAAATEKQTKWPSPLLLRNMHIGAASAHGAQAIVMAILFATVQRNRGLFRLTNESFERQTWRSESRALKWLIVAFPLLSMVNHVWAAVEMSKGGGAAMAVVPQTNWVRWGEYAVSASLMVWVIAQLSGVTDLPLLLMLPLMNATMQFCGGMIEYTSWPATTTSGGRRPPISLAFQGIAWVMFMALWLPLVWKFAATTEYLRRNRATDAARVPALVYFVVITQIMLFLSFGIVSWVFSAPPRPSAADDDDNHHQQPRLRRREMWYLILSLVAKSLLGWLVVGGALNADRLNQP